MGAYPEVSYPLMLANIGWNDSQDSVNFIYRLYGGQDWLYPDNSGNIQLCIRDPDTKKPLDI
jgi:hypothetical protein